MHDTGAGTVIIWFLIVGGILLYEWLQGNLIWDTSAWMIRQKKEAKSYVKSRHNKKYVLERRIITKGNSRKVK